VFEVPIMLSPSVQDYNLVVAAYVVPPFLTFVTKYYIVLPLKKRAKVQKVGGGGGPRAAQKAPNGK
jgi:hypothetical protein